MSKYIRPQLKPYGMVLDTNPFDVDDDVYTLTKNMRFTDGRVQKMGGERLGIDTVEDPYFLQFNGNHAVPQWYYMTDGGIWFTDFSTNQNIDQLGAVSNGTEWSSDLFNNIPIFNNTVDAPWVRLFTNDVSPLPAFPTGLTCKVVRPYRSFLVALNTKLNNDARDVNRVLWSDVSDNGALPPSWDIADPTKLAGDVYLTSSPGEIIDGAQLRDLFIIYKTHAIYIMRLVGGQGVMTFEKVQVNTGVLTTNCIQEFNGIHFVVADGDVVLFDGQSVKSIADGRVRKAIFENMDRLTFVNSFVVRYDRRNEMWFCYPSAGSEYPNKAAIWNWADDTWTFRELSNSRHIESGLVADSSGLTYPNALFPYNSVTAQQSYSPTSANPTVDTLVSVTTLKLGVLDDTPDIYGLAVPTSLFKDSMMLGSNDMKIVKKIIPRITAATGTQIFCKVGVQNFPDDPITFSPEVSFIVGTDREINTIAKGRYISVRFRTDAMGIDWKLHSFNVELAASGRY